MATPSPTWKLELNEAQVKEALAEWVNSRFTVNATAKDISFRIRESSYGSMDQRENYPAGLEQAVISVGIAPKSGGFDR